MVGKGLQLLNTILSWLKKLSLKEFLLLACFISVLFTAWTANSYRNKYIEADGERTRLTNELRIEKDEGKVTEGLKEIARLQKDLNNNEKENLKLHRKLEEVRDLKITRTEFMKELNYVEDTETACRAFASIGHPICDP